MDASKKILQSNNKTELWNNIVDSINNNRYEFTYLLGLIIYIILITVIFSKNPYGLITEKNEGAGIFLSLLGGFLILVMLMYYVHTKQDTDNVTNISALSYMGRVLSVIGMIAIIVGIIYLFGKMGSYFNNTSYFFIYVLNALIAIGLVTILVKYFRLGSGAGPGEKTSPSWLNLLVKMFTYIPCLVLSFIDYVKYQYQITTKPIVILLIAELVLVGLYFVLPIVMDNILTHNALQLLKDPINLNFEKSLDSFEHVNYVKDKFQYHYAISGWFYINSFPPETNPSYDEYTSILNIGDKPNILYNVSKNTLRVKMKTEGHVEKILFETTDFKMQKWNHVVINYNGNALDIFINNELVSTTNGVIPYNANTMITSGSHNGISGGVCNVMYFNDSISRSKVNWLYSSANSVNPPVI